MQFFTGFLHKIRGPCLLLGISFRKPGRRGEFHLEIGDLEFLNLSRWRWCWVQLLRALADVCQIRLASAKGGALFLICVKSINLTST